MIKHVVMFKFPEPTEALTRTLKEKLDAMVGKVPSLLSLETGIDTVRSERSFDAVLISTHADRDALAAYAADPVHQTVVAWIKEQQILTKVVDYEY